MSNAYSLLFLEGRSFGISLLDASTRTMLFFSLYIISNRLCFVRSCKVVHSSCSIMLLTDEVVVSISNISCSPYLNHLHRWMSFCWYGSHTELAYSRVGLTRDTYAFSLIDLLEMFMFLLRKLMVLLALELYVYPIWGLIKWYIPGILLMYHVRGYVHVVCNCT
jgi:hypothetical protein